VSNFRFFLVFIAIVLLLAQVWNQRRGSEFTEWLWMVLMAAVFVGIWLATRRRRLGGWRHTRRFAVLLLVTGLVGSTALLCTVTTG
jgi:uncharacterized membrane protein